MFPVENVRNRWFVGDFPVIISSHTYARCANKSCPFSVLLSPNVVGGSMSFVVERVVFPQHCHAMDGTKRTVVKDFVLQEIKLVEQGRDQDGSLKKKHEEWQHQAQREGRKLKEELAEKEKAVNFAVAHPDVTGREIEDASKNAMTREAIDMARKRKMEKRNDYPLEIIIASKKHHLLKNDGQEILIFGDDMAVQRLASTKVIHADGTFTCVLQGYAQLYILHATVENNVSLPVLFCLVKGKTNKRTRSSLGWLRSSPTTKA